MSTGLIRAALLLAGAGALVILLSPFGTVVDVIALAAIVAALVLTAPARRAAAGGWWSLLAAGAALSVLGALLALVTEPVGGVVAVLGGIAVLVAVALGYPTRR